MKWPKINALGKMLSRAKYKKGLRHVAEAFFD